MPSSELPRWFTACPPAASDPPTLRSDPPSPRPEPDDADTIAVPLAGAPTLPCARLSVAELPTLRATPDELAALIELTRRPGVPQAIQQQADPRLGGVSEPPIRHPDSGQPRLQSQRSSYPVARPVYPVACGQTRQLQRGLPRPAPVTIRPAALPERPGLRGAPPGAGRAATAPRSRAGGVSAMMPTQLWFGPVAAGAATRPAQRRGFWTRLWTLLGLGARPRERPWSGGDPWHQPV